MPEDPFSAHRHDDDLLQINPARTAVLTVDMLNDFCVEGGAMVLPGAELLYGPQNAVNSAARKVGSAVFFLIDSHRDGMRREREFQKRTRHCIEGSWGARVVDPLEQQEGDISIIKRRYSGFYNTELDLTLKDMRIDTLIVMGVVTNICVRSTVHDAFFLGYRIVVPEDCVAATGPREQISSLYDISTHFGWVSHSKEVVDALSGLRPVRNKQIPA